MLTVCARSCEECTAPRGSAYSVLLRIAPGSHNLRLILSSARGLACALCRSLVSRQARHRETKRSQSLFHSLVTSCDGGVSSDSGRTGTAAAPEASSLTDGRYRATNGDPGRRSQAG